MGATLELVQKSSKSMTAIVGSARITPITGSITFAKRANLLLNLASKKPKIKETQKAKILLKKVKKSATKNSLLFNNSSKAFNVCVTLGKIYSLPITALATAHKIKILRTVSKGNATFKRVFFLFIYAKKSSPTAFADCAFIVIILLI